MGRGDSLRQGNQCHSEGPGLLAEGSANFRVVQEQGSLRLERHSLQHNALHPRQSTQVGPGGEFVDRNECERGCPCEFHLWDLD